MQNDQIKKGLSGTQKTGFVLLLVFGILAISLGLLQLRNTIYNPFVIKAGGQGLAAEGLLDEETRLQTIDTDHDGLNDYEELNFYETSPYLPDTDSDGIEDKVEIEQGTDPLCPAGQACEESTFLEKEIEPITSPLGEKAATAEELLGSSLLGDENISDLTGLQLLLQDPDQLRQMLLLTGKISEEELAKVDDETLLKLVNDLLEQQADSSLSALQAEEETGPGN